MAEYLALSLLITLALLAGLAVAFFRLRRRHRRCRHALNSARSDRDRLRLRVAALEGGKIVEAVRG